MPGTPLHASNATTVQGALLCDFVPRGPVATAVASSDFTTKGSITGVGEGTTGACSVYRASEAITAIDVLVGSSSVNALGPTGKQVRADVARATAGWYVFPASVGVGYSHPEYTSTVRGRKVTGALSYLDTGSMVVGVRLYRPEPGRDAVADAAAIARAVAAAL